MKLALSGGAYEARSLIASAQRSVNLVAEPMPEAQGEPSRVAHYPTPGTRLLAAIGPGPIRGIRQAATGGVYVVSGSQVYSVNASSWAGTSLGSITAGLRTPISMADNGLDLVIVDGTANGWQVGLAGNTFAAISDPSGMFSGADRVDYLDTYLLLNKPRTPQFYISGSLAVDFDPLDFANKSTYPDLLVTLAVAKREVYLLGERTTEIWYDAGATDTGAGSFPFAQTQGVFIDHGIVAKYSVANYDNGLFWLSRDRQGQGIVLEAADYKTKRVSTYAIEAEIAGYSRIDDAIGYCYALGGHAFYVLTFPHADRTWVYDITTGLWHEWVWIDSNGAEHRHRSNCHAAISGLNVVGDWQNGNLYALDNRVFTDNGQPIKRVRSFPHILADGRRVFYRAFIADMDAGSAPETTVAVPAPPVASGFTALPLPPAGTNGDAIAISADGAVVIGEVNPIGGDADSPRRACYWPSPTSAPVIIGTDSSGGLATNADGSVILISQQSRPPALWTAAGGLVEFGVSDDYATSMSADGSRLAGSKGNPEIACYWNGNGSVRTSLGTLPGHNTSRAMGISADGSVIVGQSYNSGDLFNTSRAWRWTATSGMVDLGLVGGATGARAFGVSDDGALVAGGLYGGPDCAFEWTAAGGMVAVPGMTVATGVSGDGSTIIGSAFHPDPDLGDTYLGYKTDLGVTVPTPVALDPADPGFVAGTYPDGVSADGQTMVGFSYGNPTKPWVYRVTAAPAPTPAVLDENLISLSISYDRGHSFGSSVSQPIGRAGEYRKSLLWRRLGMGRDAVMRLDWSTPMPTALQGAWIDAEPGDGGQEKK